MKKQEWLFFTTIALIIILSSILITNPTNLQSYFLTNLHHSLSTSVQMIWITWWALVIGFTISGGVEAWVEKKTVKKYLYSNNVKSLSYGSVFGFISSSCSYSAISTSKNLFKKGGSAAATLGAFMFASTNFVIEIGLVILLLLGFEFLVGNFIGGVILIILMSYFFSLVPNHIIEKAREHAMQELYTDPVCGMDVEAGSDTPSITKNKKTYYFCSESCKEEFSFSDHTDHSKNVLRKSIRQKILSKQAWSELARKQWKEWRMVGDDILAGFILAGIISGFIPKEVWTSVFSINPTGFEIIIFSILGTIIGVITFVCSVGNVPFGYILWINNLPFGAVLSYIYADLIVPPIINAYKQYYGLKFAVILSTFIFISAILSGVVVHVLFLKFGFLPTRPAESVLSESITKIDYRFILNILTSVLFIVLYKIK